MPTLWMVVCGQMLRGTGLPGTPPSFAPATTAADSGTSTSCSRTWPCCKASVTASTRQVSAQRATIRAWIGHHQGDGMPPCAHMQHPALSRASTHPCAVPDEEKGKLPLRVMDTTVDFARPSTGPPFAQSAPTPLSPPCLMSNDKPSLDRPSHRIRACSLTPP